MTNIFYYLLFFILGLLIGVLFFGGLWLTLKRVLTSKRVALWFLLSFITRTAISLFGFYLAAVTWQGLISCLSGFIVARYFINTYVGLKEERVSSVIKEAHETES